MIRAARRTFVRPRLVALLIFALHSSSRSAEAQVDPLLFLKTQTPDITLIVDTTSRMQRDADETYYDPNPYTKTGASWEATIGVTGSTTSQTYYRKFVKLGPPPLIPLGAIYQADRVETVGDLQPGYATLLERTRIEIARRGVLEAIDGNMYSVRFNLLRIGQVVPGTNFQSAQPVYVTTSSQQPPAAVEMPAGLLGIPPAGWKITRNTNLVSGNSVMSLLGPAIPSEAIGGNTLIRNAIATSTGTTGALLPLGLGDLNQVLSPIATLLQATLSELIRFLTGQPVCKNAAIVMVVGGGEPLSLNSILLLVGQLLSSILGHRVPIHVVAIAPPAGEVSFLQTLTDMTGGRYTEITKAMIDVTVPGQPVPEVVNAINWAVQHALLPPAEFNKTTSQLSAIGLRNLTAEHQTTSPITGTVNLKGAKDITGTIDLPNTEIFAGGKVIPQRSNVLVTSGFTLPGFAGQLRAFRTYKPVPESGNPIGYKFEQDGTRLWVAKTPAEASRNILTVLPNGTMTEFSSGNAQVLAPYLGPVNAADLIQRIRNQPLGAIVGSTPAIMDPPSLDPPPDADYEEFKDLNHDRRSVIFVGANDGMMHAIDARTGIELWALIPFNLLPKLRTLPWGHGVDAGFRYMVDSSPKLSDVKVGDKWRTYLFFGESGGGTFYNALDVTLDGISATADSTEDSESTLLSYFETPNAIKWVWAFPKLTSFDATIAPYGDIAASATTIEKTVGETWSDPAVGQVVDSDGPYAIFVGSGFLPYTKQQQANRDGTIAGTSFYVLSAETGQVLASRDVGSDNLGENVDSCRVAGNCERIKNALMMDPLATGSYKSRFVEKIYIGDLDGRIWRIAITKATSGAISAATPVKLYDAGTAQSLIGSMAAVTLGSSDTRLFFGTGSDMLPSTGVSEKYSLRIIQDTGASTASPNEIKVDLVQTDGAGSEEKVTGFPTFAGGIVFFTTVTHVLATPCTPFNSTLYALTYEGGVAYDTNADGEINTKGSKADSTKLFTATNARATAPFIVDQHLALGLGNGSTSRIEIFGDSQDFNNGVGQAGVRILSWREVR